VEQVPLEEGWGTICSKHFVTSETCKRGFRKPVVPAAGSMTERRGPNDAFLHKPPEICFCCSSRCAVFIIFIYLGPFYVFSDMTIILVVYDGVQ
jgi:hypothetical protein